MRPSTGKRAGGKQENHPMTPEVQIVPDVEALYRTGAAEFVRLAGEAVAV
jgi:hypothetical protein